MGQLFGCLVVQARQQVNTLPITTQSRGILGLCWDYIGIMEKKMETLGPFKEIYKVILGVYRGYIGVTGILEKNKVG